MTLTDIRGIDPTIATQLRAWYNEKKDHNRLTPEEKELARQIGLDADGDDTTTTICWGQNYIKARPEGGGYWGERIPQKDPRVDAYELKINPQNESFYLPMPGEGYAQFENMVNNVLQDGKRIIQERSFYYVEDLPGFAKEGVLTEARRQLTAANAANADYRVEWLVSDQKAVDQLTALFKEQNMDIIVTYFPD